MSVISQKINGLLLYKDDVAAVFLDDSASAVTLALGLYEKDSDAVILPESILDDWGHEISPSSLYEWLQENGDQFPRAEVFGQDLEGKTIQRFLREIELVGKFPCFAYKPDKKCTKQWIRMRAIIILNTKIVDVQNIQRPQDIDSLLAIAKVSWWASPEPPDDLGKIIT